MYRWMNSRAPASPPSSRSPPPATRTRQPTATAGRWDANYSLCRGSEIPANPRPRGLTHVCRLTHYRLDLVRQIAFQIVGILTVQKLTDHSPPGWHHPETPTARFEAKMKMPVTLAAPCHAAASSDLSRNSVTRMRRSHRSNLASEYPSTGSEWRATTACGKAVETIMFSAATLHVTLANIEGFVNLAPVVPARHPALRYFLGQPPFFAALRHILPWIEFNSARTGPASSA